MEAANFERDRETVLRESGIAETRMILPAGERIGALQAEGSSPYSPARLRTLKSSGSFHRARKNQSIRFGTLVGILLDLGGLEAGRRWREFVCDEDLCNTESNAPRAPLATVVSTDEGAEIPAGEAVADAAQITVAEVDVGWRRSGDSMAEVVVPPASARDVREATSRRVVRRPIPTGLIIVTALIPSAAALFMILANVGVGSADASGEVIVRNQRPLRTTKGVPSHEDPDRLAKFRNAIAHFRKWLETMASYDQAETAPSQNAAHGLWRDRICWGFDQLFDSLKEGRSWDTFNSLGNSEHFQACLQEFYGKVKFAFKDHPNESRRRMHPLVELALGPASPKFQRHFSPTELLRIGPDQLALVGKGLELV